MENLAIDQNNRNVGGGVIHGTTKTLPFFVNSNGELLCEVVSFGSPGTITATQNLVIDENERNVGGAVTDDAAQRIVPLTVNMIAGVPALRIE